MEEQWKDIPFLPGYKISSKGRVSGIRVPILKTFISNSGYERIVINKKHYSIHRLMMEVFYPCVDMKNLVVNHKDGNKSHNELDNLEWCTLSENSKYNYDKLNFKANTKAANEACSFKVVSSDSEGQHFFKSIREACRYYDFVSTTVSRNLRLQGKFEKNGVTIQYQDV